MGGRGEFHFGHVKKWGDECGVYLDEHAHAEHIHPSRRTVRVTGRRGLCCSETQLQPALSCLALAICFFGKHVDQLLVSILVSAVQDPLAHPLLHDAPPR